MFRNEQINQRMAELRQALHTEGISRRDFLKVSTAAAVATGLTQVGPVQASMVRPGVARALPARQASSNTFVFGSGQDISNLDPQTGSDYSITWAQRAVYDSLLMYAGNPPEIRPLLATEATGNEDATVWTIKLTDQATFHDGSPVTAEAVQFSFGRMLRKNLANAWMFTDIMTEESVQIVDPTTLQITLTKPFAPFDAILPWLFVVNPAVVQANEVDGDEGEAYLREHEAGSGPYTIARWEIGSIYEFQKWPDYWYQPEGVNLFDRFIWRIIRESSTKRIAMEAGEIQYADTLTPEDYEALGAAGFTLNASRELTPFAIKLNNRVGPTSDVNVRKALMHAMDYQAALDSVLGYGGILQGPLSPDFQPWHKSDLVVPTFDMEAAKAALAQSQYPDGFDLEYVYVTGLAFEEQVGLILLENCLELGINVIMTPLVWPDMVARAATPETSPAAMAVYGGSNYLDPDNFLYAPYHSSQAGSWNAASHYSNPEVDALLEEGRSTTDQAARKQIYDQVQDILVRDCVEIWIMNEVPLEAWDPAIVGEPYMPIMGGDIRTFGYGS